jgi:hypothetical protein
MKNKFLFSIVTLGVLFFNSCRTKRDDIYSKIKKSYIDKVEVIKFMGTIRTQPYPVDEKIFWSYQDEHAKLLISNLGFIDDIKSIKDTTSTYFEDYNYAFIVKKGKETDTLYSDSTLKSWILKKGKKNIYFYDKNGETADNLRHKYSFFRNCW